MKLFSDCLAILDSFGGCSRQGQPAKSNFGSRTGSVCKSVRFLVALGFLDLDQSTGALRRAEVEAQAAANRRALLKLATSFDRAFQLPMPHAPGAHFFGAQLSHSAFGLEHHGTRPVGVAGRGVTLRQAFEGCVGEAAEYLSMLGPSAETPEKQTANQGPGGSVQSLLRLNCGLPLPGDEALRWAFEGIGLPTDSDPASLDWMEATSLVDGHRAIFPAELCVRHPAAARTAPRQAESNGCAAGSTIEEATLAALEEIIERDAFALWWFGGRRAPGLSPELLEASEIGQFMANLRGDTLRQHWFVDLTTEFGIPVVGALSAEPDGRSVIAGFSAGLDIRRTITSAALEMCQMELAQQLAVLKRDQDGERALNDVDRLWIDRRRRLNVQAFPQLQPSRVSRRRYVPPPTDPLSECIERLQRFGLASYRVELSRDRMGIPATRVLIPGLQSAKPDWLTSRLSAVAEANNQRPEAFPRVVSPI